MMRTFQTILQRHPWLYLIPLFLLTTALAGRMLYADLLFVDEYFSIRVSGGAHWGGFDLIKIWQDLVTLDNAAGMGVLYHWVVGAWMVFLGASTFSIRLLSLLIGLLAIAMTYRVGARLYGRQIGLYGAFFLGISALYVEFMHEARAYTMTVLLAVWMLGVYHRLTRCERPPYALLMLFALLVASLAYTHYVALAWIGALGLVHLWQWQMLSRRTWTLILGAFFLGGLLYVPWMTYMADLLSYGAGDVNRQANSMDNWTLVTEFVREFSNANVALWGFLALYGTFKWRRRSVLMWALLVASLVAVMVVNALVPFMVHLRYVLFAFVPMAFLTGMGVWALGRRGIAPWWVILVMSVNFCKKGRCALSF